MTMCRLIAAGTSHRDKTEKRLMLELMLALSRRIESAEARPVISPPQRTFSK